MVKRYETLLQLDSLLVNVLVRMRRLSFCPNSTV